MDLLRETLATVCLITGGLGLAGVVVHEVYTKVLSRSRHERR